MWILLSLGALGAAAAIAWALLLRPIDVRTPTLMGSYQQFDIAHGGRHRRYGLYLPHPDAASHGIIVVLHGSHGSGAQFRRWSGRSFDALADRLGVAVVYPDGWEGHWNDCRRVGDFEAKRRNVDDVGFLDRVVAQVSPHGHPRVGVAGYSNGGFMALRWALEGGWTLDGMVLSAAAVPADANMACTARRPLPRSLLLAGTADRISPYGGGRVMLFGSDRGMVRSAEASAQWLAGAGARLVESRTIGEPGERIHRSVWAGEQGTHAELVTMGGAGHTLPQAWTRFPRLLGRTVHAIDAATLAAELFGWHGHTQHHAGLAPAS